MTALIINAIKIEQPIGTFYIGAVEARDLISISYADVRRQDGREIERYIGTQRDLSEGRVAEIKQYVTTVDACFPTGVILAVEAKDVVVEDLATGISRLTIVRDEKIAKIIDGQHRIAGFEGYRGSNFYLNVTIFVEMELEDQAMVFATINLKQTKVSKSLAYDLYDFASARSPQKTCHNVAKLLNYRSGSPMEGFIKILGKSTSNGVEAITQAAFVDRLIKLISEDPMNDKDLLKRGRKPAAARGAEGNKLVFRNVFLGGDDARIALILWNYFSAVKGRWGTAWTDRSRGAVLGRTTGFAALMRLLPSVLLRITSVPLEESSVSISEEDFLGVLSHIDVRPEDIRSEIYLPGSTGESQLLRDFERGVMTVPKKGSTSNVMF